MRIGSQFPEKKARIEIIPLIDKQGYNTVALQQFLSNKFQANANVPIYLKGDWSGF